VLLLLEGLLITTNSQDSSSNIFIILFSNVTAFNFQVNNLCGKFQQLKATATLVTDFQTKTSSCNLPLIITLPQA
jgi:hypothetical protein